MLAAHQLLCEQATRNVESWLEKVIIGQGFCPFAARPYHAKGVLIDCAPESYELILQRADALLTQMTVQAAPTTVLLVLPKGYEKLRDFLTVHEGVDDLIAERYTDQFELASFHPKYQFEGIAKTAIENYIHRSPYPIIHLLRAASIDEVLDNGADVEAILARNRTHALRLGKAYFTAASESKAE